MGILRVMLVSLLIQLNSAAACNAILITEGLHR
jgi:hypothetical protein